MQMYKSRKLLKEKEQKFLVRFLPNNIKSAHSVLFDPDGEIDFYPSPDELLSCLEAYLLLIDYAAQDGCEAVRDCISASELTLAYLIHAFDSGISIPSFSRKRYMISIIDDILLKASKIHRNPIMLDGYKRINAISNLLKLNYL